MCHSEQEVIVDLKLGRNAGHHKFSMGRIDSILDILKYFLIAKLREDILHYLIIVSWKTGNDQFAFFLIYYCDVYLYYTGYEFALFSTAHITYVAFEFDLVF
jgi:hypothetical protein